MYSELRTSSTITDAWVKLVLPDLYFPIRHITAFWCLGTQESTSCCIGATLNSKITNKKHKDMKKEMQN